MLFRSNYVLLQGGTGTGTVREILDDDNVTTGCCGKERTVSMVLYLQAGDVFYLTRYDGSGTADFTNAVIAIAYSG